MTRFMKMLCSWCTVMILPGCAQRAEESPAAKTRAAVQEVQGVDDSKQAETSRVEIAQHSVAEAKCYMIVFASQTEPSRARTAHTFATFVKTTGAPDEKSPLTSHTISWLPASRTIVLARLPEPGKNLELNETIQWVQAMNARIIAWGPFEVKKELFESAQRQVERLKSGEIAYKAIDGLLLRGGDVTNCIHAVSDIDADKGLLATGTAFGEPASALVVRHLDRWIIQPDRVYPEIAERLGVSKHDIQFRKLARAEPARPLEN